MSLKQINHSADLKRLLDLGVEIEIRQGHLIVNNIPYVNSEKKILRGILVDPLGDLAGDIIQKPKDHTFYFIGEIPCDKEGKILNKIYNSPQNRILAEGINANHYFSACPEGGKYTDYHHKVMTYIGYLSGPAESIDPAVSAITNKVIDTAEEDNIFCYWDSNSSRAGILSTVTPFMDLQIAIVGLGGTGSYILDYIAKTPVKEIHLFDKDQFFSHNAFRTPGAASLDELRTEPKKVNYLHNIYSKMHKRIVPHEYHITNSNVDELSSMNFVFICIDQGDWKRNIFDYLIQHAIPFIDVGMGIEIVDNKLTGGVRTTLIHAQKQDHVARRVSFGGYEEDLYSSNIQIAELNSINAAMAVIKWKKHLGFYHDLELEHHSIYNINSGIIFNDEKIES
jgi:hypothetical protein